MSFFPIKPTRPILFVRPPDESGDRAKPNPNYVTPKEGEVVGCGVDFVTGEVVDWVFEKEEITPRPRK